MFKQLKTSINIWLSRANVPVAPTANQHGSHQSLLTKRLDNLKKVRKLADWCLAFTLTQMSQDLEQSTEQLGENINNNVVKYIFEKFPVAISDAEKKASGTAIHWGSPVNRNNRCRDGYPYSTYKAICRQNGTYENRQGTYDWNKQLLAP